MADTRRSWSGWTRLARVVSRIAINTPLEKVRSVWVFVYLFQCWCWRYVQTVSYIAASRTGCRKVGWHIAANVCVSRANCHAMAFYTRYYDNGWPRADPRVCCCCLARKLIAHTAAWLAVGWPKQTLARRMMDALHSDDPYSAHQNRYIVFVKHTARKQIVGGCYHQPEQSRDFKVAIPLIYYVGIYCLSWVLCVWCLCAMVVIRKRGLVVWRRAKSGWDARSLWNCIVRRALEPTLEMWAKSIAWYTPSDRHICTIQVAASVICFRCCGCLYQFEVLEFGTMRKILRRTLNR